MVQNEERLQQEMIEEEERRMEQIRKAHEGYDRTTNYNFNHTSDMPVTNQGDRDGYDRTSGMPTVNQGEQTETRNNQGMPITNQGHQIYNEEPASKDAFDRYLDKQAAELENEGPVREQNGSNFWQLRDQVNKEPGNREQEGSTFWKLSQEQKDFLNKFTKVHDNWERKDHEKGSAEHGSTFWQLSQEQKDSMDGISKWMKNLDGDFDFAEFKREEGYIKNTAYKIMSEKGLDSWENGKEYEAIKKELRKELNAQKAAEKGVFWQYKNAINELGNEFKDRVNEELENNASSEKGLFEQYKDALTKVGNEFKEKIATIKENPEHESPYKEHITKFRDAVKNNTVDELLNELKNDGAVVEQNRSAFQHIVDQIKESNEKIKDHIHEKIDEPTKSAKDMEIESLREEIAGLKRELYDKENTMEQLRAASARTTMVTLGTLGYDAQDIDKFYKNFKENPDKTIIGVADICSEEMKEKLTEILKDNERGVDKDDKGIGADTKMDDGPINEDPER